MVVITIFEKKKGGGNRNGRKEGRAVNMRGAIFIDASASNLT